MARKRPLTRNEWLAELAERAWVRGQADLERGSSADALRWFERAHRIAPEDLTVGLSLAAAQLAIGHARAAASFRDVASRVDLREALIGLAGACFVAGDRSGVADALNRLLSRHVVDESRLPPELITTALRAADAPGWCWIDHDERVHARASGRIELSRGAVSRIARLPCPVPAGQGDVAVTANGVPLLGSPLAIDRIQRVEGFVRAHEGGLEGWAWMPAAPDVRPEIEVCGEGVTRIIAEDLQPVPARAFFRPRTFRVPAARLPRYRGMLRVLARDGRDLLGSPIDPGIEQRSAVFISRNLQGGVRDNAAAVGRPEIAFVPVRADLRGAPAQARAAPRRRVAVVIPVYRGLAATLACLDAVFATVPAGTRVLVVDDATPERELAEALDVLQRQRRIVLLRHDRNRGFPATANAGLRHACALARPRDMVLLNSDTLPTSGWLERLRAAVHADGDTGTATPFSNDAAILSYPDKEGGNRAPDGRGLGRLAAAAAQANPNAAVEIPTAVGFCMYIRRECLDDVGFFREDLFAHGYGEENDFCLRARHRGWRHIAVPAAYVAHAGAQSFGPAREHLIARNLEVLERLHPGYHALIAAFQKADPLAPARRRLDQARWATGRRAAGAVVLMTHDSGGGVERVVSQRCGAIRAEGRRPIVLRPVIAREATADDSDRRYVSGECRIDDGIAGEYPNLRFAIPAELRQLLVLLRRERVQSVELHHMLGHHPALLDLAARLGVPQDTIVHDYALVCPRVSFIGAERRYCGEPPDSAVCDACIADAGSALEEDIGVAALRARSASLLAASRRVIAPSRDTAMRIIRYFPDARPEVVMHEDDETLPPVAVRVAGPQRVCVLGGIGIEKGYDVLLACARDAAARRLPVEFIVVGHTIDDDRLIATGAAFVTGPYKDEEVGALVRGQQATLGFLPSIWPETWCFTLQHLWRAGLRVAAFDIGAIAERIRRTGRGWLMPLGMPAPAINNALLAVRPNASDECVGKGRA
ncbi:MAG TPA: glycosyltransferase [Acetobacteraceae bacterium]|nr:glycosyltransferase [Acetobacteraceae bacterium]